MIKWVIGVVGLMLSLSLSAGETDFPVELLGDVNGMSLPRTDAKSTGSLIKAAFNETILDKKVATKAKKRFFQAVGELLEIVDKSDFTQLASDFGYTIYDGDNLKRKIDISGFYAGDAAPTMNDAVARVCNICLGPIGNAKSKLDSVLSLNWYNNSFELKVEVLGTALFDLDLYVDRGDVVMIEGVLKAAEGALYLLRGLDIDMPYETIIDAAVKLSNDFEDEGLDFVAAFDSSPFAHLKVKSASDLTSAKSAFSAAIDYIQQGDALVKARTDSYEHLIQYKSGQLGDIVEYILRHRELIISCIDEIMNPVDIGSGEVEVGVLEFEYTGNAITPLVGKLTVDGEEFPYDISGSTSATEPGTYEIVLTGYGRSTGTKTIVWQIAEPPPPPCYDIDLGDGVLVNCVSGTLQTASTFASVTNGYTNIVCTGWIGTGDVPATGVGSKVSFTVTRSSTLHWQYATNYWVEVTAPDGGDVALYDAQCDALSNGWMRSGL